MTRAVKGTGVTYATSPMGGDHTEGLTVFAPVDHHDRQGQVACSAARRSPPRRTMRSDSASSCSTQPPHGRS